MLQRIKTKAIHVIQKSHFINHTTNLKRAASTLSKHNYLPATLSTQPAAHSPLNITPLTKIHTFAEGKQEKPTENYAKHNPTLNQTNFLPNKSLSEMNDAEKVVFFLSALENNTLKLEDVIATTTKEKILNTVQEIIDQGEIQRSILENAAVTENISNKDELKSDIDRITQSITETQLLGKQLVTAIHVNDIAGDKGFVNEKTINDKFTLAKQNQLRAKDPNADISKVSAANTAKAFMFLFKKLLKTNNSNISVIDLVRALTHLDTQIFANQKVEEKLISKAHWLSSQCKFVLFRSDIYKFLRETMEPQFKDANSKEIVKAVVALTAEWYFGIFNRSKEGKAMNPSLSPFASFFTPPQSYASLDKVLDILHGTSLTKDTGPSFKK